MKAPLRNLIWVAVSVLTIASMCSMVCTGLFKAPIVYFNASCVACIVFGALAFASSYLK